MARERRHRELMAKKSDTLGLTPLGHTNLGFEPSEAIEKELLKNRDDQTLQRNLTTECEQEKQPDLIHSKKGKKKKESRSKKSSQLQSDGGDPADWVIQNDLQKNLQKRQVKKKVTLAKGTAPRAEDLDVPLGEAPVPEAVETAVVAANDEGEASVDKVFGVFVHYADVLKLDYRVVHPLVKVSLVNLSDGKAIAKSDRRKSVTSYYEGDRVPFILPMMTQPFDFKKRGSVVPRWEELLIFNERFDYLVSFGAQLGLFIEIIDFISMAAVGGTNNSPQFNNKKNKKKLSSHLSGGGWHRVAWAFLRLLPSQSYSNLHRTLRLQLYRPAKAPPGLTTPSCPTPAWYWWNQCSRQPYPASIHITVEAVPEPQNEQVALRSMKPTQSEGSSSSGLSSSSDLVPAEGTQLPRVILWSRLPGQLCKIPDAPVRQLETPGDGCGCVKFSPDGQFLVAACPMGDQASLGFHTTIWSVLIWNVSSGGLEASLSVHRGPVYDLDWQQESGLVASASGDGTVSVWSPLAKSASSDRKQHVLLSHPTYVYAVRFHPNEPCVLATGGYDCVLRIWKRTSATTNGLDFVILTELAQHHDYVTRLEFDIDGQVLFSGDSAGRIGVWDAGSWSLRKILVFNEFKGASILSMKIHPGGRRLLVQSRSLSNPVVMLDLKLHVIMQTFVGCQSFRRKVCACITPCGSFVFASGQDGAVYVWNADNGSQQHIYPAPLASWSSGPLGLIVSTMDFHPLDHMLAFATLPPKSASASHVPIFLYKYQAKNRSQSPDTHPVDRPLTSASTAEDYSKSRINVAKAPDDFDDKKLQTILKKIDQIIVASSSNDVESPTSTVK